MSGFSRFLSSAALWLGIIWLVLTGLFVLPIVTWPGGMGRGGEFFVALVVSSSGAIGTSLILGGLWLRIAHAVKNGNIATDRWWVRATGVVLIIVGGVWVAICGLLGASFGGFALFDSAGRSTSLAPQVLAYAALVSSPGVGLFLIGQLLRSR